MKKIFLLLLVLVPMMLSAQNLRPKKHPKKELYGYWGEKKNGKEGFVISPKYEKVHPFVGEYAFVCHKDLWGIIGKEGKFVVAPKYDKASKPYDGATIVQLGAKYGLIKGCKEVLRVEYESVEYLGSGAFRLKKNGLYGLADASGNILIPVEYENITTYKNGYKLTINGQVCLTDRLGKIRYRDVLHLQNDIYIGYSDKLEFINSNGEAVEQPGNILLYTSKDGKTIDRSRDNEKKYRWKVKVISNICRNGQGIMVLDQPITSIGKGAFSGCRGLTSITIPNSVTEIGNGAFFNCYNLTIITIPNSVTSIGDGAFENCSRLTSITIPNSVTSIRDYAFRNCCGLTSITIPNSVTSIGKEAFMRCYGLTSITIPNSVTEISDYAFDGCTSLPIIDGIRYADAYLVKVVDKTQTSYSIKPGVAFIGGEAFKDCKNLTSVTIPNSVTSIGKGAFKDCDGLTSITIPNSVTEIGNGAFFNCYNLTSITIPNSVTEIGNGAFFNCRRLESVYCKATTPPTGGYRMFSYYSNGFKPIGCKIYVPRNSVAAYKSAEDWKEYADDIVGYDF